MGGGRELSKPQPLAMIERVPRARDVAYPGTIELAVDASDTAGGIFWVEETIPVTVGPLTLLYPKWIPGEHSPAGQVEKVAGLLVTSGSQPLRWLRDPIDPFAFHIDVPAGVSSIDVSFQYLSATAGDQGLIVVGPNILNLKWHALVFYPAGYFARNIVVAATVTYPVDWTFATALRRAGAETEGGGTVSYEPVTLETLVDSPVIAGLNSEVVPLPNDVTLTIFADRPDQAATTPEQRAPYRSLVEQALELFGARHYDHYDILLGVSDVLSGQGLEHHRSSEQVVRGDFFTNRDTNIALFDLIAHEFAHSWNGKFRRPWDLWTPDFRTPMQNSLLWVYEGQTVFWDGILAARSGFLSKEDALDGLAVAAAGQMMQAGRAWRPLVDTGASPIIASRRPAAWPTWQRGEDYYAEGQLIWIDVDSILREQSGGERSMDDFARNFFGMRDGDWGVLTYGFEDVVAALNNIVRYDWTAYFEHYVHAVAPKPPLDWLTRYNRKLVFTDEPGRLWSAREAWRGVLDLSFSLGIVVTGGGEIARVVWDSPAFAAGMTAGMELLAINGRSFSFDALKRAIVQAKGRTEPLLILVRKAGDHRTLEVRGSGGLCYPHLKSTGPSPDGLDDLYAEKAVRAPRLPSE